MSRFGGVSKERPVVFKTRSKLGTHLSTQCSGDERQSRPCPALLKEPKTCDVEGIIRVKTLITERIDTPNFLSPIILPSDCIFTKRLIEHCLVENYHAGTQLLLSLIKEKYWILGGRRTVRKVWNKYIKCRRFNHTSLVAEPSSLPADRVKDAAEFEVIGVDLADSLYLKTLKELLRRTLSKAIFTFEELTTILCECEKVVNSRPLTYLSEDLQDHTPIPPAMVLCDRPSTETTDLDMLDGNPLRKRLRFRVKMMKELRECFRKEYLGQLVQRHRQHLQSSNI
ncbi:integrase catalytic domain-containing protein [Trichonephila clavipes]|nr:integrase catalytic domain-containing protein [Trichonephila clavipes]